MPTAGGAKTGLLAKVKNPRPVSPARLRGPQLALYNTLACCYPQDILRKMLETRSLTGLTYTELAQALQSATDKSAHHLPTLIHGLSKEQAALAVNALANLGFAGGPGAGPKPVIFFDEERERLWEVVSWLLERGVTQSKRLPTLVESGQVPDDFGTINAMYKINLKHTKLLRKRGSAGLADPAYKLYHQRPLEDVRRYLRRLQPVAMAFGYVPPVRVRGYA